MIGRSDSVGYRWTRTPAAARHFTPRRASCNRRAVWKAARRGACHVKIERGNLRFVTSYLSSLPESRVPDPASAPPLRWGILAPGWIASLFTEALAAHTTQQVVAVGSRSVERAAAFAQKYGIARSYGSYEELVDDDGVDAVYVASPHSGHHAQALLSLAAGKPTLVEKAFTRNAGEASDVIDAARSAGLALMEAMWPRFQPQTDVIRQLLADGALGTPTTVIADHGQYFDFDPQHRLYNPDLAGGAVLDLGVYPISFASFALGAPTQITAVGDLTTTGVDGQVSLVLRSGDAHASLNTTLYSKTPTTAIISGPGGMVQLSGPFYAPATLTWTPRGGEVVVRERGPVIGHRALCYEAAEFARVVTSGATESEFLPLDETLSIMKTMDEVRRQIGMTLPGE